MLPFLMIGFGFGTSFAAMWSQLSGVIYKKAAETGGDLIGKIEESFTQNDDRNPTVFVNLIGDHIGDCVGQSNDIFQSIVA